MNRTSIDDVLWDMEALVEKLRMHGYNGEVSTLQDIASALTAVKERDGGISPWSLKQRRHREEDRRAEFAGLLAKIDQLDCELVLHDRVEAILQLGTIRSAVEMLGHNKGRTWAEWMKQWRRG